MKVTNFAEQNTIINKFLAELRDKDYQNNPLVFRNNVQRIGEMMAYEMSKTLEYAAEDITTPLGIATTLLPQENIVIATILRAGLPFHAGFLHVFDHADNAFVSAYRVYTNEEHTEVGIHTEYLTGPNLNGKTLIITDPMLATGGSMVTAYESLLNNGTPSKVYVACVVATPEGIDVVKKALPEEKTSIWCAAIDPGMNEHKYIVPGFGDAGDLCFGEKL
ncbi:MAG: uracil phosphoribosyltransferase [Prevotellaceae bacterium]|nr:uracil phosphoribosyltransferase [Prevotella sp.]MDD7256757.1 uracil phosphoribosyltransferase [Prevotellaceae bacterium]MDY6130794.1 uracil phosphoribosyltransferase [Prevotella sp.]